MTGVGQKGSGQCARYARWKAETSAFVLALLVALTSACARGPKPASSIASPEGVRREAQLLAMLDRRQPDTFLVDELLRDADSGRRARVALAIGQLRIKERFPVLRQLLLDGDTAVAASAAYALGIAKDTASVLVLARAFGGAPEPVAREAAWSLGEIGEPARTVIEGGLAIESAQSRFVMTPTAAIATARTGVAQAAMVMAAVKLKPAPVELVTPWLADSSHDVVRAAAYVIGRLRSPAGARAIIGAQAHVDEEVRQHVARALTSTVAGDSLSELAIATLRVLVNDKSERVRTNAVRSLETFGPSVAEFVEPLFHDSAPNVRVAASEGIAQVFATDSQAWLRAWNADTALATRKALLAQIRRLSVSVLPDIETQWASNSDWQYRVAAITSSSLADTMTAVRLTNDPDARVVRAARSKLVRRGERQGQASGSQSRQAVKPAERTLSEYEAVVRRFMFRARPMRALIDTDHGTVTLELYGSDAPLVVEAFVRLAQNGTYQNTWFHRVVPNFVAQDGDSTGDGTGSAGFTLRESWTRQRHLRGCLGLATSGPDTGGSQYYMCHSSQPHLDGAYTVFGQVVDGFDAMDRIVQGDRMLRIRIVE